MDTEATTRAAREAPPAGTTRGLPAGLHAPVPEGQGDVLAETRDHAGPSPPEPALPLPSWVAPALSTLLILSLISLATLTTVVQLRSRSLNQEITRIFLPARELVQEIQVATSLQVSALNGFVLTGDEALLASYTASLERRERALARLSPLAARIGGDFAGELAELNQLADRWKAAVPDARRLRARAMRDAGRGPARLEQSLSHETLAAAAALADGINTAVLRQRERIDAAERLDWQFTIILSIVAISAGLVNRWLGRRVRQLARESARRRQELEKVLETKGRLMRGLSHDLRNPLGAVDGYAQILQMGVRGDLTTGQREIVQRIHRAVTSSVAILDDVLDLSRAEAGQLSVTTSAVDLPALLQEVAEDSLAPMAAAGLTFRAEVAAALPIIKTDEARVRQVLGNLLSNAAKYTPPGGSVMLSAAASGGAAEHGRSRWLVVEVADTGPGIPEDERENIFEEFYRLEGSPRRIKGLGIGLAISRRIARMLGGDLTVGSVVGQGSAFALWLPLASGETSANPVA